MRTTPTVADAADRGNTPLFLNLFAVVGRPLSPSARVLDFGCGDGEMVRGLAGAGMDAHGCDFAQMVGDDQRLEPIEDPYRLPYPDDTFDAIVSMQVFEHVQDYDVALRELRRVLRPGCPSLHIFPPRYTPIEPHLYVPLATVIQCRPWLRLWAALGVRNRFQQGKTALEVMELNHRYLREQTNYLPRRELMRRVRQVFPRAELLTWHQLAASQSRRARRLCGWARRVPALALAYGELGSRALMLQ